EMYKNQLQELAQRSCFSLPSYTCVREGPDHAPRFKAIVNFNGDTFESPHYCSTLRQAEHSAAEAALVSLCSSGPSHPLAARILVRSLLLRLVILLLIDLIECGHFSFRIYLASCSISVNNFVIEATVRFEKFLLHVINGARESHAQWAVAAVGWRRLL
ncbi:Double-stranded RNA-binding protein 2, partial [Dorcoceras hygrometricum]